MKLGKVRSVASGLGLALLFVATLVAVPLTDGNVVVALAPLLGLAALLAILRLPLRVTILAVLFLILCIDNPLERPFAGFWTSPLDPIASLLYDNLHKLTGIGALRFSLLQTLSVFLLCLGLWRRKLSLKLDPNVTPTPSILDSTFLLSLGAIACLELWGLARGGDFKQSLWQVQNLLFFPILGGLMALGLRGRADQRALGMGIVLCACFKALIGAYFLYRVARPQGIEAPYVTQHTDSVLFVTAVVIPIALWMEKPSWKHLAFAVVAIPPAMFGMFINDRRLAYVSLGACLLTLFLMTPWNKSKRILSRGMVLATPLLIAYLGVGWSSNSPLFKPVAIFRSVAMSDSSSENEEDNSTEFRHTENYNLIRTWMPNPLLGSGFGHEYDEVILLPDISRFFPAYRYVPHNSILWLWGIGGLVGFTCLWMVVVIGLFMAARAYRAALKPEDRATAMVCICYVISFLNQAFGDMGTQSWESTSLLALSLVMAGKLAVELGVWPAPKPASRTLVSMLPSTGLNAGARP